MNKQADHAVQDFASTSLSLRADLIFTPGTSGARPHYIVEDPLNSRYFRVGHVEYTFVSLLDGRTTVHDALRRLSTLLPNHSLTESDAAELCRWLVETDLAHTPQSSQAARLARQAIENKEREVKARGNPLVFRVSLFQPDRLLASLNRGFGWMYSLPVLFLWLALVTVGAYKIFGHWDRFAASSYGIFAPDNWLWIGVCWIVLKIVHETSHGIVCKRYGGNVRETGLLFILFAPLAYVDVTASWRFRSRWQRIHVAAAGMYAELAIAAVAAIVWSNTESAWLSNLCYNTVVMAGITTILFNANPLMKFDGYYMLSDAVGIPNLCLLGQQYLRYLGRKLLLGMPGRLPNWPAGKGGLTRTYGIMSFFWRILVCISLTLTAVTLFHGAGIVLACLGVVLWVGLPALRFVRFFFNKKAVEQPRRLRFLLTTGVLAAGPTFVFGFLPWPGIREAPAVVEYSPPTVVRAASAGFVRTIHVQSGQPVEADQLLVTLENRELAHELTELELEVRQSEIRGRKHEQKGELAAEQAEAKKRESLLKQLAEKQQQVQHLEVRAPSAGKVVGRDLDALAGTYLEVGDEILSIGDERKKELRVSVAQADLKMFSQRIGQSLRVSLPQQPLWESRLEKVIPRATLTPPHPALAAVNGGPLPVKNTRSKTDGVSKDSLQLFTPRFTGIVELDGAASAQLRAGQTGHVSYRPCDQSIGDYFYQAVSTWVRKRLHQRG